MQTEIIEPNPLLIEYLEISNSLFCDFDGGKSEFINNEEWHYVPSNLEQNIFLLKRLYDIGLLKNEVNICDCGIGLGTTMYDLYLQSKEIEDKKFTFSGVEKHERYIEYLKNKLMSFWENNLTLIEGEIMNQNYSKYNLIYSYSPFKTEEKLNEYYTKIINEIESGSIIIEFRNNGYGYENLLSKYNNIKEYKLDDIVIFVKV